MPTTYELPSQKTLELLEAIRSKYHERLDHHDIRIGVLMAHAPVDEKTNKPKGHALKGYAGAGAAAQVSKVSLKDRVTKKYDVELLLDGDHWDETPEETQAAILDHEMTHILPMGRMDDIGRPIVKMRDEDFIVWGFLDVVRRHGAAAIESRSVKALMDAHGQLLLHGIEDGMEGSARNFVGTMAKAVGPGGKATISSGGQSVEIAGK